jgi:phosphatidylserine decarboxylase
MTLTAFIDSIRVFPQYLLPQRFLSKLVYKLTRCQCSIFKNSLIKSFIRYFNVDMSLADQSDVESYIHFNHFFTRELRQEIRPITKQGIACPIDGSISQIGQIDVTTILQAKSREFDLKKLLTDEDESIQFKNGNFVTLYLSPRDYHRIHMPMDGQLRKMIYVPGKLFSVNAHTTRVVNNLFSLNERVVCFFDTEIGPMAIIMVGAIFVGSMETVWAGQITPSDLSNVTQWSYKEENKVTKLQKGREMGRFNMGSTVILLFGKETIKWVSTACPNSNVTMGSCLGEIAGSSK